MADERLAVPTPSPQGPIGHGSGLTIAQRLDRIPVTALHAVIVAVCTLGLFADIAEVALGNSLAAMFLAPPHNLPRGDLALLLAAVFAGGAIGAPVFGAIGDRFGRRCALQGSLALMAAGSLAAAASPDLTSLTIARCVSGFAIGGYSPLVATYLADLMPPRRRGLLMLVCTGLGFLGAPAILLLIRAWTSVPPLFIEGWRWALGLGGIVAGLSAILFACVPESPRWLAAVGHDVAAEAACRRLEASAGIATPELMRTEPASDDTARAGFRALMADPLQIRRTARFLGLYSLAPWATIGFPLLSAAVLIREGFGVDQSLVFAALTMLGPTLGALASALIIDRLERRFCLAACVGTMAGMGIVFANSANLTLLTLSGVLFNMAAAIYAGVLGIYGTEILPTHLRASALTSAWAAGRMAVACVPVLLLPLLTDYGASAMFAVVTLGLGGSLLLVVTGPPGRPRQPVI
ncbi:MFS transporter [Methylobacterium sp. Leaf113]|uniref:MFS transporter n=1 Tax=Methylobacterium sp. Leaf113 TaxID=1736259 RepID=UPI0006F8FC2D|nr:MFS transporter [Methylobacterium sp. Leaf113]KQP74641.1 MFS transporter [Methylobacterium sp. Leaf113]